MTLDSIFVSMKLDAVGRVSEYESGAGRFSEKILSVKREYEFSRTLERITRGTHFLFRSLFTSENSY